MDIYTQADGSGSAPFCDVVLDHGGQTECGWADVNSFSLWLFKPSQKLPPDDQYEVAKEQ